MNLEWENLILCSFAQFIWMRNGWDIRGLVFTYSAALHGTLQCCAAGTLFWLYTCPCLKSKQWTCSKPEFHAVLQNRMCCNFAWWLSMLKGPPLLNLNLIWVWPCSVPSCLSIFFTYPTIPVYPSISSHSWNILNMRIFKSKIIICNSESFESEIIIYENENNYLWERK